MPNTTTDGDELEIDIAEAESAVDTQTTDEDSEGESELTLESEEKVEKLSPAEENAKRQEEAWLEKVVSGKAEITDAPKWLQGRIESRLNVTTKLPETEEVVKKVIAQERETLEFKALQSRIPKLTATQAKELQERFAELRPLGKTKALQLALDLMGLSQKINDAERRGIAKARMSLPVSGQPSVRKLAQVGGVDLDVIHDDKKWNEMIRGGKHT